MYAIGTTLNFDAIKQYYIPSPYHDPTRPLICPQDPFNLAMIILLPTQFPNFFPKMNKLVETPLDGAHYRFHLFITTTPLHKLNFIFAKLSSFLLKKQNNCIPSSTMNPEQTNNALSEFLSPRSNTFDYSTIFNHNFIQVFNRSSFVVQTVNPNVCMNTFSYPLNSLSVKF